DTVTAFELRKADAARTEAMTAKDGAAASSDVPTSLLQPPDATALAGEYGPLLGRAVATAWERAARRRAEADGQLQLVVMAGASSSSSSSSSSSPGSRSGSGSESGLSSRSPSPMGSPRLRTASGRRTGDGMG
ncbi:hypothetical protein HK405_008264, partial [Cladochytrium tenue]